MGILPNFKPGIFGCHKNPKNEIIEVKYMILPDYEKIEDEIYQTQHLEQLEY